MNVKIVLELLLSIGLGALIGLERGVTVKPAKFSDSIGSIGGIRTYALISFFGAISAWLSTLFDSDLLIIFTFITLGLFIMIYYYFSVLKEKQFGLTSEIAALVTFFLGVFVMLGYSQIAIILSIILTFILGSKSFLEKLVSKISREELNNTIKFAIISMVILPLLPDQKFSIADILGYIGYTGSINNSIINLDFLNPYGIWFFVVLMSGISYAGYVMSKLIGEKGSIVASGAIGGLISSTAVTAAMTQASTKDTKNTDLYVVSTLIASTIMFIRVIIIVLFFNINMLTSIAYPSGFMFIGMATYIIYFYIKSRNENVDTKKINNQEQYSSPFSIGPALKFAGFVLIIKFVAGVGGLYQEVWGDYFFYALGTISGLADVDAISQTMAVDALDGRVGLNIAAITIVIAIMSNNLVKGSLALKFGERKFGIDVMMGFVIAMFMGILGMVVLSFVS